MPEVRIFARENFRYPCFLRVVKSPHCFSITNETNQNKPEHLKHHKTLGIQEGSKALHLGLFSEFCPYLSSS